MKTVSYNCEPKRKPRGRDKGQTIVLDTSAVKRAVGSVRDSTPSATGKTRATAKAWGKEGQFYKPLPKEFRRGGFSYRQIAREGGAAIYEQTWNGCPDHPAVCFEVIRVKPRGGFEIGGRYIQPAEVYPSSKLWGTDGFTLADSDAAFSKLRDLA